MSRGRGSGRGRSRHPTKPAVRLGTRSQDLEIMTRAKADVQPSKPSRRPYTIFLLGSMALECVLVATTHLPLSQPHTCSFRWCVMGARQELPKLPTLSPPAPQTRHYPPHSLSAWPPAPESLSLPPPSRNPRSTRWENPSLTA